MAPDTSREQESKRARKTEPQPQPQPELEPHPGSVCSSAPKRSRADALTRLRKHPPASPSLGCLTGGESLSRKGAAASAGGARERTDPAAAGQCDAGDKRAASDDAGSIAWCVLSLCLWRPKRSAGRVCVRRVCCVGWAQLGDRSRRKCLPTERISAGKGVLCVLMSTSDCCCCCCYVLLRTAAPPTYYVLLCDDLSGAI